MVLAKGEKDHMKPYRQSIEEENKRGENEVEIFNRDHARPDYGDGYRQAVKDIKRLARENMDQSISITQLEFLFI